MLLNRSNNFRVIISAVLAVALIGAFTPLSPAYAIEQEQIDAAKDQAASIRSSIDALQTELNKANDEYQSAVVSYNDALHAMNDAQKRIDAAEAKIDSLQGQLSETAANMYKRGSNSSYVDVLLGANTFSDFINGWDMFARISNKEASLVQEAKDLRAEADAARSEFESQKNVASQNMKVAQEKQLQIASRQAELSDQVAQITEEISQMETEFELEAEAARQAAMAAQAASAAFAASVEVGEPRDDGQGFLANPCPDSWESSGWGYRSFDNKFHLGVDMAADMGAPVYAAESGTVIGVSTNGSWNGGAGNYVNVAHGNGLVTKYFHISTAFVNVGDTVERGQNIATVGSTGNSTGPHLHFQVEIDGVPVCPYDFL